MFCKNCGKKLNDDAKFCNGCGVNFQTTEDVVTVVETKPIIAKKRHTGLLITFIVIFTI